MLEELIEDEVVSPRGLDPLVVGPDETHDVVFEHPTGLEKGLAVSQMPAEVGISLWPRYEDEKEEEDEYLRNPHPIIVTQDMCFRFFPLFARYVVSFLV